ncbi:mRNA export factor elf1 [Chytridium lagenaria]|nr:mRNA export factor elf1 [Chytridium lagenaria]
MPGTDSEAPRLLNAIYTAESSEDSLKAADDLAKLLKSEGVRALTSYGVLEDLHTAALDKKSGYRREGAMIGFTAILRLFAAQAVPFLLPHMSAILILLADKGQVVRDAAWIALTEFIRLPSPKAIKHHVLPFLYEHGLDSSKKWQTRSGALTLISSLAKRAPTEVGECLVDLIPRISECIDDTRKEVSEEAFKTMNDVCSVVGNQDLQPKIPILVDCISHPTHVADCIAKLSATTFVAEVNGPALAILVPILVRALNERSMIVQRQTVIIIDNLCKLFLPQLLPGLDRIIEMAAFPEVRALATAAKNTLLKAGGGLSTADEIPAELTRANIEKKIESVIFETTSIFIDSVFRFALNYMYPMCEDLLILNALTYSEWNELNVTMPTLTAFMSNDEAVKVTKAILHYYQVLEKKRRMGDNADEEDEGEEICNCDFSLAYGGMMLLNHTNLTLIRGKRYGLCGPNGAGKTTLMRAIANSKVDGFPPADQVRTVMVEHALQGEDTTLDIVGFIRSDERLSDVTTADIRSSLISVGFAESMLPNPVGSLSGGWKMKLELARAILMKADVLLLDEPTNHLDVANVKWLEDYLISQTQVTCLIVSHDSGFLDNVCTNIIHYERKKLVNYRGNLSEFVKMKPEAKSYYTLSTNNLKFTFPPPAFLTGVRSNTKAILYMTNVTYQYPGSSKKSLTDVSVQVSLSSRVGIIGHNGAGKSTLIKVLLGELQPQEGKVWKHPNLRVGYVAQHAFHHLEQHLDLTPKAYIQWRYANGDDREVHEKVTRVLTEEDKAQMDKAILIQGEMRKIEYIIGRQKLKKSFQYEIKWLGKLHKHNTWIPREQLYDQGFTKIVQEFDDYEAAREGLGYRELTPAAIRKHFEDVGLDPDIAEFNNIGGLSGGQKVKVVIAAAMWQNPHMLVLDEPTNFLDRDSLGGLAVAIRDWGGGVVMISHNDEFVSALCPELWHMEGGKLVQKGKRSVALDNFEDLAAETKKIESKVVSKPRKKKLTRNQLKEREVRRRERHLKWLIEGGEKPKDSDSD